MPRLLSYSQVNTFVQCPKRWELAYLEGWRAKEKSEALVFGSILHQQVAGIVRGAWHNVSMLPGAFPGFDNAVYLSAMGTTMLNEFERHFQPMMQNGSFVTVITEKHLRRGDVHGYVDCVADVDDYRIVIDWKTTEWPYDAWKAHVDDQLTAYAWLAEDYQIDEVAFVTLQKPHGKVEWLRSMRTQAQIDDFAQKVEWVRRQMDSGVRHRNPGNCGWCSFVGHCAFGEELGVRNERDDF